eukprot:snap_masked-scaffold_12-processed-gene-9.31-mRNA-1 protein AED:1.00 eAED:1.00 QI:0/-1/0/0/-1/1/1/0/68
MLEPSKLISVRKGTVCFRNNILHTKSSNMKPKKRVLVVRANLDCVEQYIRVVFLEENLPKADEESDYA